MSALSRARTAPAPGAGREFAGLGAAFIDDWFIPSVHVAALLGFRAFAFGATIAVRREVLARIGGFKRIADQLADDYRLGELTRRAGLRTVLSRSREIETSVDERSLGSLVRHELRSLAPVRAVRPLGYALCFITLGLAPVTLGVLAAAGTKPAALAMLAGTVVARLMLHFASHTVRAALLEFWILPLSDLLVLGYGAGASPPVACSGATFFTASLGTARPTRSLRVFPIACHRVPRSPALESRLSGQ